MFLLNQELNDETNKVGRNSVQELNGETHKGEQNSVRPGFTEFYQTHPGVTNTK
jgi:hypothetical protein